MLTVFTNNILLILNKRNKISYLEKRSLKMSPFLVFFKKIVGRMNKISVDMDAVWKLADCYCSPVLFCELEVRPFVFFNYI